MFPRYWAIMSGSSDTPDRGRSASERVTASLVYSSIASRRSARVAFDSVSRANDTSCSATASC